MRISGNWNTRVVRVDGQRLPEGPSQRVWNHSPDGFNWGYGGSGPAQLALAILMRIADDETALRYYQRFKAEFIAPLPQGDFDVEWNVKGWLDVCEQV